MSNEYLPVSTKVIDRKLTKLQAMENLKGFRRWSCRNEIKKLKIELQAFEEGQSEDVTSPNVTNSESTAKNIDKNNFKTYADQITQINKMYNNESDYGGEFLRPLLDMRVSFIAGAGLSVLQSDQSEKGKKVIEWINNFLDYNNYYGSRFIEDTLLTELEGKCLLAIKPNIKERNIRIRSYSWYKTAYNITMKDDDYQEVKSASYKPNPNKEPVNLLAENLIYIKIGGTPDRVNNTPPRIANVLTDIENASRAKFDIRKNNHIFGRVTPYFQTKDEKEAKSLLNKIQSLAWKIGRAFAGTAQFSLVEPSGNAVKALVEEIVQLMKIISLSTGIPVQLLAYPELLSNRATSQDMLENINASTIKERTILEEAITKMIKKAMQMATNRGWCPYYLPDSFVVKIDLTTYANLKQIIEVWYPLLIDNIIDKNTFRSMLPGIDPEEMKRLVDEQVKEEMKKNMENIKNGLIPDPRGGEVDEDEENNNEEE